MTNPLTLSEVFDEFHPQSMAPQPSSPIVVYLFSQAVTASETELSSDPRHPLPYDEHSDVLEEYTDTLDEIESIGWIERTDNTISLTLQGVRVAGPMYAEICAEKH